MHAGGEFLGASRLSQATFLSNVRNLLQAPAGGYFYFIIDAPLSGDIYLGLELSLPNSSVPSGLGAMQLLPDGYGWRRDTDASHAWPELPATVELVRSHEYLDLPRTSLPTLHMKEASPSRVPHPLYDSPDTVLNSDANFVLPYLASEFHVADDFTNLYKQMDELRPCRVRIEVSACSQTQLGQDRFLARYYLDWLRWMCSQSPAADVELVQKVARTYQRYQGASTTLSNLRFCFRARTSQAAEAVARTFAANLGYFSYVISEPEQSDEESEKDTQSPTAADAIQSQVRSFFKNMLSLYSLEDCRASLQLPYADHKGLSGVRARQLPPFPCFHGTVAHERSISLGTPRSSDSSLIGSVTQCSPQYTISVDSLTRHSLIVGSTGSGKSVATKVLVTRAHETGATFLVVEPVKAEYFRSLSPAISCSRYRFAVENHSWREFPALDPFVVAKGITVSQHISFLKTSFEAAFPLSDWMALTLENALLEYFTVPEKSGGCGYRLLSTGLGGPRKCLRFQYGNTENPAESAAADGEHILLDYVLNHGLEMLMRAGPGSLPYLFPSYRGFRDFFLNRFIPREFKGSGPHSEEVGQLFRRRFANLGHSILGLSFARAEYLSLIRAPLFMEEMLSKNSILELEGLADDAQKCLVMSFILSAVYQQRACEGTSEQLKHLLVVEEAHRVFSASGRKVGGDSVGADSRTRAVELFCQMLAEIRAYGQGIVIVEQIPSKLAPDAVKNTNLKLILRMASAEDREYIGNAINLNSEQKDFAAVLRLGECIVADATSDTPVLIRIPGA